MIWGMLVRKRLRQERRMALGPGTTSSNEPVDFSPPAHGAEHMSITTPANETEVLDEFEAEHRALADRWAREYAEARRRRLALHALPATISEIGRTLHPADPERARTYFASASRMADICKRTDIEVSRAANVGIQTLGVPAPTPKEEADARAMWGFRINEAMAPIFEERARAQAKAAAAAQQLADAQAAVIAARQALDAAERKAREPTVEEARRAVADAEASLAAMAKETSP